MTAEIKTKLDPMELVSKHVHHKKRKKNGSGLVTTQEIIPRERNIFDKVSNVGKLYKLTILILKATSFPSNLLTSSFLLLLYILN